MRAMAKALGAEVPLMAAYEAEMARRNPRDYSAFTKDEISVGVPQDWSGAPFLLLDCDTVRIVPILGLRTSRMEAGRLLPSLDKRSPDEVDCLVWIDASEKPEVLRNAVRLAVVICTSGSYGRARLELFVDGRGEFEKRRTVIQQMLQNVESMVRQLNQWPLQEEHWRSRTAVNLSNRLLPGGGDAQGQSGLLLGRGGRPQIGRELEVRQAKAPLESPEESHQGIAEFFKRLSPQWELLLDVAWLDVPNSIRGR